MGHIWTAWSADESSGGAPSCAMPTSYSWIQLSYSMPIVVHQLLQAGSTLAECHGHDGLCCRKVEACLKLQLQMTMFVHMAVLDT